MPTLSEKLQSLGVRVGARNLPPPRSNRAHSIEEVVPGRSLATPFGDAFVVETVYPSEYRHGSRALLLTASLQTIADWAHEERVAASKPGGLVFLDTETTGLMGGTGTFAFLVGIGRYDGEDFRLTQLFMRDPAEEPAMLSALEELVLPLDALVTFNGKAFDVPLLNARYITNRRSPPFAAMSHLDLLPLARRLWRDRLTSRALGQLETHILAADRTGEDVPGFMIPQMYFDYLRSGDARPLKQVLYHNAMDVVAMAALLSHVAQLLSDPIQFAAEHGVDMVAIGKLFEDLGRLDDAAAVYARGLELDLPEETFRKTTERLARVHRRRGESAAAVELWRRAAMNGQIYAHVELAKFYEHQARDVSQALEWTKRALVMIRESEPSVRREWLADLEHRLKRLETKRKRQM